MSSTEVGALATSKPVNVHARRAEFWGGVKATFPLVVGPLALSKSAEQLLDKGVDTKWVWLMTQLANFELVVATIMVIYVSYRFIKHPWSIKH